MGEVWAATHEITGGRVALKFLKAAGDPQSEARRRFLREARAASLVDHPNVVPIRDVLDHENTPVLVMDLLVGETLAARLQRVGPLELGDAARIALQIVSAVGAAHEAGLIHRDLKPENVFLSKTTGGAETARVLDFGIAKLIVAQGKAGGLSTNVTQSGAVIGTPAYMAPEQVFGEKSLDHRVDVWALGVVLHEMLTGARPVDGENFGQIAKRLLGGHIASITTRRADLPDDVSGLVDRMLAREREARLDDLREAARVLALHAQERSPSFGPPRPPRTDLDSGPIVDAASHVDPAGPTENVTGDERRRTTDEPRDARPASRADGAIGAQTAPTSAPRLRLAAMALALATIGGVAALAWPRPAAPGGATTSPTSPTATTSPTSPTAPTSPTSSTPPSTTPPVEVTPPPSATSSAKAAASGEGATTKASSSSSARPQAAAGNFGKQTTSSSSNASATSTTAPATTPPAAIATPSAAATMTGGLVTKPPF